MAEGTYDYECMRAELLGLDKPDREEFLKKQSERIKAEEDEIEEKIIEEVVTEHENLKHVSGGLEELNNILSVTQKKLHRFKTACGSLTNLLKIKVGSGSNESLPKEETDQETNGINKTNGVDLNKEISIEISSPGTTEKQVIKHQKKQNLAKALDDSIDKLDTLLYKAENAQYSMAQQNKEMKSFLNK